MDHLSGFSEAVTEVQFDIPSDGFSLAKDNGVYKKILKEGINQKTPSKGSKVTVHYTGRLEDGTVFDSSYNHGSKFSFNVGRSEVIKGWDLAVASMSKGEKCELYCAPKYAYGARGSPPKIPANATLIFEIELFDWEAEDLTPQSDKGILRETLQEGIGYTMPNNGAYVNISLKGEYNGKVFDEREVEYNVSEADPELNLVPAIDITVKRMKRGEKSQIAIEAPYGFGEEGSKEFGIPPNAKIDYCITLKQFEKAKEAWEMTDTERIEQSQIVKEKGTKLLQENKPDRAIIQYAKILDYLEYLDAKPDGDETDRKNIAEAKELKLKGLLNLSLCYGKLNKYSDVISKCEEILKLDQKNEKGLYRLAEAYLKQRNYNDARIYFAKVAKLYPNNKSARTMEAKCAKELKETEKIEQERYKGMFDKFSKNDEEAEIRKKVSEQEKRKKAKASMKGKTDEAGEGAKNES